MPLDLSVNFRQGWSDQYTLAYYGKSSIATVKTFIAHAPDMMMLMNKNEKSFNFWGKPVQSNFS